MYCLVLTELNEVENENIDLIVHHKGSNKVLELFPLQLSICHCAEIEERNEYLLQNGNKSLNFPYAASCLFAQLSHTDALFVENIARTKKISVLKQEGLLENSQ